MCHLGSDWLPFLKPLERWLNGEGVEAEVWVDVQHPVMPKGKEISLKIIRKTSPPEPKEKISVGLESCFAETTYENMIPCC